MPSSHRLVLYPQGYPSCPLARSSCDALVHVCGGDSRRTFDLRRKNLEDTLRHALRVRAFQNPGRPALCVVHQTAEFDRTLALRRAFENSVPIARSAIWALFWDHQADTHFLDRAQADGLLIGDVCDGATYRHTSGQEYLVLSPLIDNNEALAVEAECVARSRSFRHREPMATLEFGELEG